MNITAFINMLKNASRDNIKGERLLSSFYVLDIQELCDFLKDYINLNYDKLFAQNEFIEYFHIVTYKLIDMIDTEEDFFNIKFLINSVKNNIVDARHIYTKDNKQKDTYYNQLMTLNQYVKSNLTTLDFIYYSKFESEELVLINYIINNVKDIDALYYIFKNHSNYINLKNNYNESLFRIILREYIYSVGKLSDEDKTYYKRVIIMMLENEELFINTEEIDETLNEIKYKKMNGTNSERKDLSFIEHVLNDYVYNINKINTNENINIINKDSEKREDFRGKYTFTIDNVNSVEGTHIFDDAFTIEEKKNSYRLYIHIPDVDMFIKSGTDEDMLLRDKCMHVNLTDHKRTLINKNIVNDLSLYRSLDRYAISFIIVVNKEGKILSTKAVKSIIRVNENLNNGMVNDILKHPLDIRYDKLNKLFFISKKLKKQRKFNKKHKQSKAKIITTELNILPDIAIPKYFNDNNIIFPYKNYAGKDTNQSKNLGKVKEFLNERNISDISREVLFSILEYENRIYYDIVNHGNSYNNNLPSGNVGNPLREYISLETDRLIKDLMIDEKNNEDEWMERIERDVLEYSERSSKIRELYYKKR